jgi:pyruvate,water dikinase
MIVTLADAAAREPAETGGKANGLASLLAAELPVPEGVVVTTALYRRALQLVDPKLVADAPAHATLAQLEHRHRRVSTELMRVLHELPMTEELLETTSGLLAASRHVVVRSSGTLEDSATASFSGILDTISDLSTEGAVLDAIADCWASGFEPRVALYLREKGIAQQDLAVAVIVQTQIEAQKSGLVFSRDPTNRYASGVVVEAILGPGEDLVSGEATPERYAYAPRTGAVTVTRRHAAAVEGGYSSLESADERRLTDAEVGQLADWALAAERLFGMPQDMEWAFADDRFWLLQSRPIVFGESEEHVFPAIGEHTVLLHGSGVSPAVGSGRVLVAKQASIPEVGRGTVAVVDRLTNDLAIRLRRAAAVVADEGGATSHGANILREFGVPCVIGTARASRDLEAGRVVTVDGFRGAVYDGDLALRPLAPESVPETAIAVYVSVLVPERARSIASQADGVSSLRNDYFLLDSGVHPIRMIRDGHGDVLEDTIYRGIVRTAELFAGKPVWYKTMDAPTDEFRRLAGGEDEPHERNPLLGWRGIGRELEEREMLDLELRAVRRAVEDGHDTLGVKLPLVRLLSEYLEAEAALRRAGLEPHRDVELGVSVETPAVAMRLAAFLDAGADFVSVGLSDLTMCVLALDRESRHVAELFDPGHPSVLELLARIANTSRAHNVFSCVTGESAHDERVLPEIVRLGFDAVGVSLANFATVKQRVAEVESSVWDSPLQNPEGFASTTDVR